MFTKCIWKYFRERNKGEKSWLSKTNTLIWFRTYISSTHVEWGGCSSPVGERLQKIHTNIHLKSMRVLICFLKEQAQIRVVTKNFTVQEPLTVWGIIMAKKSYKLLLSNTHWSLIRFSGGPLVLTVCWMFFVVSFSSDFAASGVGSASFLFWSTSHQKELFFGGGKGYRGGINLDNN